MAFFDFQAITLCMVEISVSNPTSESHAATVEFFEQNTSILTTLESDLFRFETQILISAAL